MARTATAGELRGQGQAELKAKVVELKEELFTLRFQSATGQLESHGRLRAVRKDIARIYTVLHERHLGITEEPGLADAGSEDAPAPSVTRGGAHPVSTAPVVSKDAADE